LSDNEIISKRCTAPVRREIPVLKTFLAERLPGFLVKPGMTEKEND
jgi:hypothetical protein